MQEYYAFNKCYNTFCNELQWQVLLSNRVNNDLGIISASQYLFICSLLNTCIISEICDTFYNKHTSKTTIKCNSL